MKTAIHQEAPTVGPWHVFEKKLSDGSSVFDVHYCLGRKYAGDVVIHCESENAAFDARDAMNAAIEKATGIKWKAIP